MKTQLLNWIDKYLIICMSIGGLLLFGFLIGVSLEHVFFPSPPIICNDGIITTTKDGWIVTMKCFKN